MYKERKAAYYGYKYYKKYDFEAIQALHDMIFKDDWSLSFALQFFRGSHKRFSEERRRNYFLAELYKKIKAEKKIQRGCRSFYPETTRS